MANAAGSFSLGLVRYVPRLRTPLPFGGGSTIHRAITQFAAPYRQQQRDDDRPTCCPQSSFEKLLDRLRRTTTGWSRRERGDTIPLPARPWQLTENGELVNAQSDAPVSPVRLTLDDVSLPTDDPENDREVWNEPFTVAGVGAAA